MFSTEIVYLLVFTHFKQVLKLLNFHTFKQLRPERNLVWTCWNTKKELKSTPFCLQWTSPTLLWICIASDQIGAAESKIKLMTLVSSWCYLAVTHFHPHKGSPTRFTHIEVDDRATSNMSVLMPKVTAHYARHTKYSKINTDAYYYIRWSSHAATWALKWGSRSIDTLGEALIDILSLLDFVLVNRGSTTTFEKNEHTPMIDMTFISGILVYVYLHGRWVTFKTTAIIKPFFFEVGFLVQKYHVITCLEGWEAKSFDREVFMVMIGKQLVIIWSCENKASPLLSTIVMWCI